MNALSEWLEEHPIVPYIRESDFAVRKPWIVPRRRLLDYLLIYVQEGRLTIDTDVERAEFADGEFALLQPGTVHELRGTTNTITPFAHLDLFYRPNRADSFPTKPGQIDLSAYRHLMQPRLNDIEGLRVPLRIEPSEPIRFRDTLLRMVQAWLDGGPLRRLEAQTLASELTLALLNDYVKPPATTAEPVGSLNWITSYCSFNLAEPLTVADMARRAHLSPSRFNVVFRDQFGTSPHQYLLGLRIRHAKELLATTGHDLYAVAAYCGFADVHHLSKAFKKAVGLPPGEYRRQRQKARIAPDFSDDRAIDRPAHIPLDAYPSS